MCKAPNVKKQQRKAAEEAAAIKPEYLRNPYLDAAMGQSGTVDKLRTGRSSLRQDLVGGTVAPSGLGGIPSPFTGLVTRGLRGLRGRLPGVGGIQPTSPDISGGTKLQPGGVNDLFSGRNFNRFGGR